MRLQEDDIILSSIQNTQNPKAIQQNHKNYKKILINLLGRQISEKDSLVGVGETINILYTVEIILLNRIFLNSRNKTAIFFKMVIIF